MNSRIADIIRANDLGALSLISKTDFHLHASRSCRMRDFARAFGLTKSETNVNTFSNFDAMEMWVNNNIHPYIKGKNDWERRIALMFLAQKEDSIKIFEPSFTVKDILQYPTVNDFICRVEEIKKEFYPDSELRASLSLSRKISPDKIQNRVEEYLETGWFRSLDLCNDEAAGCLEDFKEIYRYANKLGIVKKAHVGEYREAKDIVKAIDFLMLDEVQHGVTIIEDVDAIKFAIDRNIMFNVCPASNITMGLYPNYFEHPIKKMFHVGLKITICTDDLLVFNKSVSEQIVELHKHGIFSPIELTKILNEGFIRRKTDGENSRDNSC